MGVIVGIFGMSGDGKTTSTIINKDGKYDMSNYTGMNPETHVIINLDRKALPIKQGMWCKEAKNYIETSEMETIRASLQAIAKNPKIKSVALDTINVFLLYKEYNDRKKLTFDQWRDIAMDVIEINKMCNELLRDDQIAYILGHVELITDVDGKEKKALSMIGKKSKKAMPEGFYPIVLMTRVDSEGFGENAYYFQTRSCNSTAKTPLGMFDEFEIPNSMSLVDEKVRKFYNIK